MELIRSPESKKSHKKGLSIYDRDFFEEEKKEGEILSQRNDDEQGKEDKKEEEIEEDNESIREIEDLFRETNKDTETRRENESENSSDVEKRQITQQEEFSRIIILEEDITDEQIKNEEDQEIERQKEQKEKEELEKKKKDEEEREEEERKKKEEEEKEELERKKKQEEEEKELERKKKEEEEKREIERKKKEEEEKELERKKKEEEEKKIKEENIKKHKEEELIKTNERITESKESNDQKESAEDSIGSYFKKTLPTNVNFIPFENDYLKRKIGELHTNDIQIMELISQISCMIEENSLNFNLKRGKFCISLVYERGIMVCLESKDVSNIWIEVSKSKSYTAWQMSKGSIPRNSMEFSNCFGNYNGTTEHPHVVKSYSSCPGGFPIYRNGDELIGGISLVGDVDRNFDSKLTNYIIKQLKLNYKISQDLELNESDVVGTEIENDITLWRTPEGFRLYKKNEHGKLHIFCKSHTYSSLSQYYFEKSFNVSTCPKCMRQLNIKEFNTKQRKI